MGSSQPVPGSNNRSGEGERNRNLKRNQLNSSGLIQQPGKCGGGFRNAERGFRAWLTSLARFSMRPITKLDPSPPPPPPPWPPPPSAPAAPSFISAALSRAPQALRSRVATPRVLALMPLFTESWGGLCRNARPLAPGSRALLYASSEDGKRRHRTAQGPRPTTKASFRLPYTSSLIFFFQHPPPPLSYSPPVTGAAPPPRQPTAVSTTRFHCPSHAKHQPPPPAAGGWAVASILSKQTERPASSKKLSQWPSPDY